MLSYLIPSLIILAFILVLLAVAVIAFITEKNWATCTLLAGVILLTIAIIMTIYHTFMTRRQYTPTGDPILSEYSEGYYTTATTLAYISPLIITIGLISYMISSKKIYGKATALQLENQQLAQKLNNNLPR